jgi:glycosyltransferase involved in cell wall biosynthesis
MTKVLFVQASLPVGGAERLVESLMLGFDPARVATAAICLYAPGRIGESLAAAGHRVQSRLAAHRFDPGAGAALARAYDTLSADVVYVADSAMPLFWAGWRRRRSGRPRLVVGFHSTGKSADRLQHALAGAMAFPVADRLVALAPGHRDYLGRALGLEAARFAVIGNGVDLERFRPAMDRAGARSALGYGLRERIVGIVAALRPEKNHDLFLRMAARVGPRVPDVRFVIAGDGPERRRLERQALDLGLGGRVCFLGPVSDTPALYRALDLAVLCSRPVIETFPIALVEALACGVPVVSTRVGSIADIVSDGETGRLVPPGDDEAFAAAVEAMLGDAPQAERMGAAARADAELRFDRRRMISAYEALFCTVAAA